MFGSGGMRAAGAAPGKRDLQSRLERVERLAGLTPLEGSGIVVTLRPSPLPAPRGVDPGKLQVHEADLNGVLNALRAAGAEALAVGGGDGAALQRVLAGTAARETAGGIQVNGVPLAPPFRIAAIGDPQALRAELLRVDGVVRRSGLEALQMIAIGEAGTVQVPAAQAEPEFRFAHLPGAAAGAWGSPVPAPTGSASTPTAAAPAPAAPAPAGSGPARAALYGGKGLTRYHRPGCRFGERIASRDRVTFASPAEARRAGRVACPICHPDR